MNIGVCIFDDPNVALGGWASVAGEEPKRVSGTQSLTTDTIWVTNLHYLLYKKLNLVQAPHVRDAQFFRASVSILSSELGLNDDPDKAAQTLSEIFTRVTKESERHLTADGQLDTYRFSRALTDRLVPRSQRLLPNGSNTHEIITAIDQCMQANQGMSGVTRPEGSIACGFVFPRGAYARWILSQPVPSSSKWQEIKMRSSETIVGVESGKQISGTKAVIARLKELGDNHAVILRIRVIDMDSFFRPFATFGVSATRNRNWAVLPEVLELIKYAKVSITAGYRTSSAPFEVPNIDLSGDDFSISRGLFLENVWTSLTQKLANSKNETPMGVFYRAYDRIACARAAATFAQHRYVVGSFGTGRVVIFLREGEMEQAAEHALELGLTPPYSMIKERAA